MNKRYSIITTAEARNLYNQHFSILKVTHLKGDEFEIEVLVKLEDEKFNFLESDKVDYMVETEVIDKFYGVD